MAKRELEFKEQFNEFFRNHNVDNLYDQLSVEEMIKLKKVVSCINNIITLRATTAFVDKLYNDHFITAVERDEIINEVNGQHANTNGFDVKYEKNEGKKIIAEVKCNIPVDNTSFGPVQKEGIVKDIDNLKNGKSKAGINDTSSYYKFMVILDCAENVRECMQKIIAKQTNVTTYSSADKLNKKDVFVVYVSI